MNKEKTELGNRTIGTFDTPKKLNRSAKNIPAEIVDSLESGAFTFEMIQELKNQFPIFTYHSCLTIHGNWPIIERRRIGGYSNIRQNENGSVEVLWSAIDIDKLKATEKMMQATGSRQWHLTRNSSKRYFGTERRITPENMEEVKTWATQTLDRLNGLPIYGRAVAYVLNVWGLIQCCIELHVYAMPEGSEMGTALALLDMDGEQYTTARNKHAEEERKQEEEWAKERQARELAEKERAARIDEVMQPFRDKIAALPMSENIQDGVLIRARMNGDFRYEMVRKGKAGSFGRFVFERVELTDLPENMDGIVWVPMKKQITVTDMNHNFRGKGFRLFKPVTNEPAPERPKSKPLTINTGGKITGVKIVRYSEKAIAVIGDTRPVKDVLKLAGGRFNPFLTVDGSKVAGWIFPANTAPQIEALINQ